MLFRSASLLTMKGRHMRQQTTSANSSPIKRLFTVLPSFQQPDFGMFLGLCPDFGSELFGYSLQHLVHDTDNLLVGQGMVFSAQAQ